MFHPISDAKLARFLAQVRADGEAFAAEDSDITPAVGYFLGYPEMLQWIGFEPIRIVARQELEFTHAAAARRLMIELERSGIDSGAIFESARICRELLAQDPQKWIQHDSANWPDCLGQERANLPHEYARWITAADIAIHRLDAGAGPTAEQPFEWSLPSTKAELCTENNLTRTDFDRMLSAGEIERMSRQKFRIKLPAQSYSASTQPNSAPLSRTQPKSRNPFK